MANYEFWPATIAACAALWLVISYRLKVSAQPLRLEMADKGEAILASPVASETSRAYVRSLLKSAFSYRGHLLVGLFVVPIIAVAEAFGKSNWLHKGGPMSSSVEGSEEIRHALEEITDLHVRITYANNPLLASIVFLHIGVWFMFSALLSALVRGAFPRNVSREYVVESIDYAYEMIPIRMRRQPV